MHPAKFFAGSLNRVPHVLVLPQTSFPYFMAFTAPSNSDVRIFINLPVLTRPVTRVAPFTLVRTASSYGCSPFNKRGL
jgi:hypothetical protein